MDRNGNSTPGVKQPHNGRGDVPPPNPHGHSRKGVPNKTTRILKEAILLAAEQVGEDGKGHDGLTGYLRMLAVKEPRAFSNLLQRVLPLQVNARIAVEDMLRDKYESFAEAAKAMRELGISPQRLLNRTASGPPLDVAPRRRVARANWSGEQRR